MDLKKLTSKAKDAIDKRGGVDSLKADAEELKKIAKGKGSVTDKAKAAAKAIKEPGDRHESKATAPTTGEKHPAQHAGNPADTPRKGGPPHQ
ncbi:MAG TPA: hypothetical protein VFU16_02180 [Solirubrobacterales bacterium]|nr:hypothetical protein [Solirubrobacterales bacterium]